MRNKLRGNRWLKFWDYWIGIPLCWLLGFLNHSKPSINNSISKILVIKLAALGDTVLLVPMLRSLRENFENSEINLVVTSVNADILKGCPHVNRIIEFPLKKSLKNPVNFVNWLKTLRKNKYDLVIDADQWSRISSLISWFSGAQLRVGFKTKHQHKHYVFTHVVEHKKEKHELECLIDLVRILEIEPQNISCKLWPGEKEIKRINEIVVSNNGIVAIHPGCGRHGTLRQWDTANYAKLADAIKKEYGYSIVITGGEEEINLAKEVASFMKEPASVLAGELSSVEMAVLFAKCKFVVCGNTGPMHIAAAMGTPVLAIHGPTDEKRWGPLGRGHVVVRKALPCSPCLYLGFEYGCDIGYCMKLLTHEEVFEGVKKLAKII